MFTSQGLKTQSLDTVAEQLVTDVTAEQAAIATGGKFLYIQGIQAIRAGADIVGSDDTYMTFVSSDGKKTAMGETSMSSGKYQAVNFGTTFNGTGSIRLFDSDWGNDDYLGGIDVSAPTNGVAVKRVSGSGSTYDVYYQVFG
jgi:hypothetical protein